MIFVYCVVFHLQEIGTFTLGEKQEKGREAGSCSGYRLADKGGGSGGVGKFSIRFRVAAKAELESLSDMFLRNPFLVQLLFEYFIRSFLTTDCKFSLQSDTVLKLECAACYLILHLNTLIIKSFKI